MTLKSRSTDDSGDSENKLAEIYRQIREKQPLMTYSSLEKHVIDPKDYLAGPLGWWKRGQVCLFTGRTGNGKTVLVEQMVIDAAQGKPMLGMIPVEKPMKTLYMECENGLDVMKRDILAITKYTKANLKLLEKNLVMDYNWHSTGKDFVGYAREVLKQVRPDFWVIDNLQKYMEGDLNNAQDFSDWIKPILDLIKEFNCGLLIIDHMPKPSKDKGATFSYAEGAYAGAGTSRKANMARTTFELYPHTDGRFRLHFSKSGTWAGLVSSEGNPVDHFFLEQSGLIGEPYWKLSETQENPVSGTKPKVELDELKMYLSTPGTTQAEAAKYFEVSLRNIQRRMTDLKARDEGVVILPKSKRK